MSSLFELRTRLRSRIGSPDTTSVSDDTLTDCINTAYEQIANKYRFHMARKICIVDTIAGEFKYQLPDDAAAVLRIKNLTKPRKLTKTDDRRSSEYTGRDQLGPPETYARYRGYFELTPTPDGVYTLEVFYKAGVVKLVDDGDTPVIPASWHHGIVLQARAVYFDEVANDYAKASYASQSFKDWVDEQPTEIDDELMADMDSGVSIPTLTQTSEPLLDFHHSD